MKLVFSLPFQTKQNTNQAVSSYRIYKTLSLFLVFPMYPSLCSHSRKRDDPAFLLVKTQQNLPLMHKSELYNRNVLTLYPNPELYPFPLTMCTDFVPNASISVRRQL